MVEFILNDNIRIWNKYSMEELFMMNYWENIDEELFLASAYHESPTKIYIREREFDVIPFYKAIRTKSKDGYFRYIYIQINTTTGEYYIGKVNRQRLGEFRNYQGSGVKFKAKYRKYSKDFVRYYIFACETQEETEKMEAEIVNEELLKDPFCLNLVRGGGGVTNVKTSEEKKQRQREYMKAHPEQYKKMLDVAKELYLSGDSEALRRRNEKIKESMSSDKYRQMSSERIKKWMTSDPEGYRKARIKNKEAMQNDATKQKRNKSLIEWREQNPVLYEEYEKKRLEALQSEETRKKRSNSLKKYNREHPEVIEKRSMASVAKTSKAVNMIDLETREVLRTFSSHHAAAEWLVQKGYAKNVNCVASINAVCLHKKCTTGYGYRTKAYGFGWEFVIK